MADFPRTVTPISVTDLDIPGPMISTSQSGRVQLRSIQHSGWMWRETYLLNTRLTVHKGFLAAVRNLWRNGTAFDITVMDYLTPKGSIGGSPLVNIASQLVSAPENFGTWVVLGTTAVTSGQTDPNGGALAYLIDSNTPSASDGVGLVVAFTGNATKTISWHMKAGTATTSRVRLIDTSIGPTNRITVNIAWASGVPTPSIVGGGGTGVLFPTWDFGNGWYRFAVNADSVVAASTNRLDIFADQNATGATTYIFGANAWNATVPMPYRSTSGTPDLTGPYLPLDGATGSVSNWLRAGDLVSVPVGLGVRTLEVTSDTNSQSDGGVYLPINPPLYTGSAPADNAAVTVTGVKVRACMIEPPQFPETSGQSADYGNLVLSFREVG